MMSDNFLFDMIEGKTGVKKEEILRLAYSLQNANFQDERTVRKVVREVARMANRPVSKTQEDNIVKAVVNGKVPKDLSSIKNMM